MEFSGGGGQSVLVTTLWHFPELEPELELLAIGEHGLGLTGVA
jgi:hypothetical protein